jgi:two-component system, NtrC family, response regulator AtoC
VTGRGAGRAVLLVDDERDALDACSQALAAERYVVDTAAGPQEALDKIERNSYDAAVVDLKMPGMSGLDVLRTIRRLDVDVAVVMVTGYATVDTAVEAMKEGAADYLQKPFTPDELRLAVRRAIDRQELVRENQALRERLGTPREAPALIGESAAMREVRRLIARIAEGDATVLVTGETGTGKELAARAIHALSRRASHPFIAVDCAAVPGELLESEFFGHEKGAFTGAIRRRKGSFELAHGGTLFLDEIGTMSVELQAKLLRVLQEREIQPVGSERKIPIDVRVVAATNRNLREAVREGGFREDLYYRLHVIPLRLPPLRERPDDIPLLVDHFIAKRGRKLARRIERVDPAALAALAAAPWPGNVRELESAVERAMTLVDGPVLDADAFGCLLEEVPDALPEPAAASELAAAPEPATAVALRDGTPLPPLADIERDYIMQVLHATRWNRREASRILGISTVTLWRKISGRTAEDFRP